MTTPLGRNVRLFLVEGTPTGLTTAEIMNWTGHVLAGARTGLPKFLERSELDRTGIYFLSGPDPDNPDEVQVYIGESDNVRKRLIQHNKDDGKDFWERTCVVTSKDQNITKAHARYLEARLISVAAEVGLAKLVNGTAPPPVLLPEADRSDMEYFIEQIRLILPVLGLNFLRKAPKPLKPELSVAQSQDEGQVFVLSNKKHGLEARARQIDGEFVVLAGSLASSAWSSSSVHTYSKQHASLTKNAKLVPDGGGLLKFVEDTAFSSPSAASAVILGRPDNGRKTWRLEGQNLTYAEWQDAQLDKAMADNDEVTAGGDS